MAKEKALPRHLQTLLEPGEFEKGTIRTLMNDIRSLVSNPYELRLAIQKFASEVGLDYFTPLADSPHQGVQLIGQMQHDLTTNLAIDVARKTHISILAYIDELPIKPIERKRVVMEFMATKQDFGGRLSEFEAASDTDKARFHLEKIRKFFDTFIQAQLVIVVKGLDAKSVLQQGGLPQGLDEDFQHSIKDGGFSYRIPEHPTLIGIAYIHLAIEEAFVKRTLILDGLGSDNIDTALTRLREIRREGLTKPSSPQRVEEVLAARRAFDELGPGSTKVN